MNRNPFKPFKTHDQLIEILNNEKNIITKDNKITRELLFSTSYYTLVNGYSKVFLKSSTSEECINQTYFEILHLFIDYLNQSNYSQSNYGDYNSFYKASRIALGYRIDGNTLLPKDKSICHYINNYQRDHVPPWILSNGLTLGPTISWYNSLSSNHKRWVCGKMTRNFPDDISIDERLEFLKSSLNLLHEARNNLSHSRRVLISDSSIEIPKTTLFKLINDKVVTKSEYNNNIGKKGVFAVILVLYILLYDEFQLNGIHSDITMILSIASGYRLPNNVDIFEALELPNNIIERLEKLYEIIKK